MRASTSPGASDLQFAGQHCSTLYVDYATFWHANEEKQHLLAEAVNGQHVLEMGPGPAGGLARLCATLGAASYRGVDISAAYVAKAREAVPEAQFIHDCPITTLRSLEHTVVTVSTGVFDIDIMRNEYADMLIEAIAATAAPGSLAFHHSPYASYFEPRFKRHGFERVQPWQVGRFRKH